MASLPFCVLGQEEHAKLESLYEQDQPMGKGSSHGLSLPWVPQLGIFADELLQTDLPGRPCFMTILKTSIWRKWDDELRGYFQSKEKLQR